MMSALTRLLGDPLLEYQHDDNQKIDPVKEWKHKVSQEEDEEAGEPEEEGSDEKDTESGKSAAKKQHERRFSNVLWILTDERKNELLKQKVGSAVDRRSGCDAVLDNTDFSGGQED